MSGDTFRSLAAHLRGLPTSGDEKEINHEKYQHDAGRRR